MHVRSVSEVMNSRTVLVRRVISALLWLIFIMVVAKQASSIIHKQGIPIVANDLEAFYCAGETVLLKADPYLVEPLRACEHRLPNGGAFPAQFVTPTPQPGYTLGLFTLLTFMPYRTAAYVAFFVLAGVCVAIAIVVAKTTGAPSGAVALSLLVSGILASATFGQIPPICALGVAGAGLALVCRRYTLAAVFAAIAMIEPHTGIATAIALFLFVPQTRIPLSLFALVLAGISIATIGVHANLEYFTRVLNEHAQAELFVNDQYSLSHLLVRFTSDRFALAAGAFSFVIMLTIGLFLAPKAARKLDSEACIAYVPPAATLLGGTFLHETQLIVALPAAFLFAMRGQGIVALAGRFLIIVLAATPFTVFSEHTRNIVFLAATVAILSSLGTLHLFPKRENVAKLVVEWGLLTLLAIGPALIYPPPNGLALAAIRPQFADANVFGPNAQASLNWGALLRSDPKSFATEPGADISKISFWLAIIFFLIVIPLPGTGAGREETRDAQTQGSYRRWVAGPEILVPRTFVGAV